MCVCVCVLNFYFACLRHRTVFYIGTLLILMRRFSEAGLLE